jgi:transposase
VWLAVGRTDMRKGMNGLALQVQEQVKRDPHAGDQHAPRSAPPVAVVASGVAQSREISS